MYSELVAPSMAEVAGKNARELRLSRKVKLEDFARAMQAYGVPWTSGRVGDFESGRAAASLQTLFVVASALHHVTHRRVKLADLFAGDGAVRVADGLDIPLADLRAALSGKPVAPAMAGSITTVTKVGRHTVEVTAPPLPAWAQDVADTLIAQVHIDFSESDVRMCKNIGAGPSDGAAAMAKLWGRTFRAERDLRAGPDANAQRRGQISRQLKAELQKVINDGDD